MNETERNIFNTLNEILKEHELSLIEAPTGTFKILLYSIIMNTVILYFDNMQSFLTGEKYSFFTIIERKTWHYSDIYTIHRFKELSDKILPLKGHTMEEIMIKLQINGYLK